MTIRINLFFLLFAMLAALLFFNGIRALRSDGKRGIPNAIISFIAAAGILWAANYMFGFL